MNQKQNGQNGESQTVRRQLREDLARVFLTDLSLLFKRPDATSASAEEPTTQLAEDLILDAVRERATDIHIDPLVNGARVRLRVDGQVLDTVELTRNQSHRLINQVKTLAGIDPIKAFMPQEARWTYGYNGHGVDMRVTVVPCVHGEKVAVRLLDPARVGHSVSQLGLTDEGQQQLKDWLETVSSLFLVTGPTGSGKTTTLYALLHELKLRTRVVVTIEDPVEYQIDGITQIQVDRRHGLSFAEGLKTMIRLDPDYLMLGEIRDSKSARSTADAAIGGRGIMSTLHSRDAVSAVSALRNWGLTNLEIAVSLSVVVAQRLVRALCPKCRQVKPTTENERRWLESINVDVPDESWQASGCDDCRGIGYFGRTGIFEIWRLNDEDYDMILGGIDERTLRQHLVAKDYRSLLIDGLEKARDGATTVDELMTMGELISPIAEAA